jgi:hypothetical protein
LEWKKAKSVDTMLAYEKFLHKHPQGDFADKARLLVEAMSLKLPEWEKALKTNTIKSFRKFLKKHPDSPFADKARGKIVDLEVTDIMDKSHGNLPSPKRISGSRYSKYAVINIHNDTKYNLTVRYSGPDSFKVLFSPREKGSIEIINGNYRVAASVDASHVRNYAGDQTLKGGNYEVQYYIVMTGPYSYTPPRLSLPRFSKFEAWPNKRRLPKYLK